MATKKQSPKPEETSTDQLPVDETPEVQHSEPEEAPYSMPEEPVYIPDIPAQMIKKDLPESDEILFLRRILKRNHEGGFGHHLDDEIAERINYLKQCQ